MTNISRLFQSGKYSETDILNKGLALSMEFGKNWLQPIQKRLKREYRPLTTEELDMYDSICQQARKSACDFVYKTLEILSNNKQSVKEQILQEKFDTFIFDHYSWISKRNKKALFNQGLYFASKDGLNNCIDQNL